MPSCDFTVTNTLALNALVAAFGLQNSSRYCSSGAEIPVRPQRFSFRGQLCLLWIN